MFECKKKKGTHISDWNQDFSSPSKVHVLVRELRITGRGHGTETPEGRDEEQVRGKCDGAGSRSAEPAPQKMV